MLIICAHWATPVNAYWIASVDGFLNERDVLYDCSILKTCFWSKTCFPGALCPVSWAREQQFMKRNSSADNNAPSCGGYLSILRKVALLCSTKHDDWMLWQRVFARRLDSNHQKNWFLWNELKHVPQQVWYLCEQVHSESVAKMKMVNDKYQVYVQPLGSSREASLSDILFRNPVRQVQAGLWKSHKFKVNTCTRTTIDSSRPHQWSIS